MKKHILSIIGLLALIAAFLVWHYTPKTIGEKKALIHSFIQAECEADTRPVKPLLLKALEHIQSLHLPPGIAIDLGTGCGQETRYLLKHGYEVIAIDETEGYLTLLKSQKDLQPYLSKLRAIARKFEDLDWTDIPQVDLVVASYSLTGYQVKDFPRVWKNIVEHIQSYGFFVGEVTSSQKKEVLSLLEDFDIELLEEEPSAIPNTPPLNLYSIIAQKNKPT